MKMMVTLALAMSICAAAAADDKTPSAKPSPGQGVVSARRGETYTALLKSDEGVMSAQTYVDVRGLAVVEGDIVLGTHADIQKETLRNLRDIARGLDRRAVGGDPAAFDRLLKDFDPISDAGGGQSIRSLSLGVSNLWPNKTIPYDVDPSIGAAEQARVTHAAAIWNKLGVVTFKQTSAHLPDAEILHVVSAGAGVTGDCLTTKPGHNAHNTTSLSDDCTLYQVVHEFGHVLGLRHEHSRTDRGAYITVDFSNVLPEHRSNFATQPGSFNGTTYDPCSVMHYRDLVPGAWDHDRQRRDLVHPDREGEPGLQGMRDIAAAGRGLPAGGSALRPVAERQGGRRQPLPLRRSLRTADAGSAA